jgi:hypothetical protein
MENGHFSSNINAWWLFGISTVGMVIFAELYFFNPKTTLQTQTILNTVTNTVTNEVVKEVQVPKFYKIPAEIPQDYITAMQIISNYDHCDFVKDDQVLFGMKDVRVIYNVNDSMKEVLSEDEVRAKFELTLRRNNVRHARSRGRDG